MLYSSEYWLCSIGNCYVAHPTVQTPWARLCAAQLTAATGARHTHRHGDRRFTARAGQDPAGRALLPPLAAGPGLAENSRRVYFRHSPGPRRALLRAAAVRPACTGGLLVRAGSQRLPHTPTRALASTGRRPGPRLRARRPASPVPRLAQA